MSRWIILLFGVASYATFLLVFLYLAAFLGNLQTTALAEAFPLLKTLVPYSIDHGREAGSLATALLINSGLIALFGIQHTVMARQGFKHAWTRIIPPDAERAAYVMVSNLVLILLYWQWRPMTPFSVWHAEGGWGEVLGWSVFGAGFGLAVLSTFLINHFHLLGLQQSLWQLLGKTIGTQKFRVPFLYRFVRHPLYLGFFLAFWGTPYMSAGHFLFAIGMCAYTLVGIRCEERDLKGFHPEYAAYAEQVPMLLPRPGKRFQG